MAIIIAIEGNIGTGKSTLLDALENNTPQGYLFGRRIVFFQEPLDQWEAIHNGSSNILEKFYVDQQ